MKDKATGSLDRRDFVIASLATVGASVAFAATAGAADATANGNGLQWGPDRRQKGHQRTRRQ